LYVCTEWTEVLHIFVRKDRGEKSSQKEREKEKVPQSLEQGRDPIIFRSGFLGCSATASRPPYPPKKKRPVERETVGKGKKKPVRGEKA